MPTKKPIFLMMLFFTMICMGVSLDTMKLNQDIDVNAVDAINGSMA